MITFIIFLVHLNLLLIISGLICAWELNPLRGNPLSTPQSHSQPADSAASPVSGCSPLCASDTELPAKSGCQHGLCPHAAAVHGAPPGVRKDESNIG